MPARLFAATLVALTLNSAPALAGDPIMPLGEVRGGMQCKGYSVIQGTEISEFDVEILDVIDGDASGEGPRLLVRVSGPAIEGTGVGPGFSGSPIYCDGRNAGAISESLGEYGGDVVLATPIEAILGASADPPSEGDGRLADRRGREGGAATSRRGRASARDRRILARAKPLATPLTVSGVGRTLGRALERAGARVGRPLLAAPAGPLGSFPPQPMRPGASVGVSYSQGDIQIGAIGTVAYTDEDRVWGFGHPFEGAGERRLLLQDAYVYRVINNPVQIGDVATTYKFASLGHTLGTISNDAATAVAGPHRRAGADRAGARVRRGRRHRPRARDRPARRRREPDRPAGGRLAAQLRGAARGDGGRRRGSSRARPAGCRPAPASRSRWPSWTSRCASATATCPPSRPTRTSSAPRTPSPRARRRTCSTRWPRSTTTRAARRGSRRSRCGSGSPAASAARSCAR